MAARNILWMDLRTTPSEPDLCSSLPAAYPAQRVRSLPGVARALARWRPWAVCFEYDEPDAKGLAALAEVRRQNSMLPILMLTENNAKSLANWALRRCIWDYLVKPVSIRRLCNSLTNLEKAKPPQDQPRTQWAPDSAHPDPPPVISTSTTLAPAVSYITTNFSEKLRMATAARLCDLSPFQFSRMFKKEHGFAFRDYVVRARIERAAELMRYSSSSVTEAAFDVGFNDLSYFARMFRRQLGVTPSSYRNDRVAEQLPLFPRETPKR